MLQYAVEEYIRWSLEKKSIGRLAVSEFVPFFIFHSLFCPFWWDFLHISYEDFFFFLQWKIIYIQCRTDHLQFQAFLHSRTIHHITHSQVHNALAHTWPEPFVLHFICIEFVCNNFYFIPFCFRSFIVLMVFCFSFSFFSSVSFRDFPEHRRRWRWVWRAHATIWIYSGHQQQHTTVLASPDKPQEKNIM